MRQLSIRPVLLALALICPLAAHAQEPNEQLGGAAGRGQFAGMQRVTGEVTAIAGDTVSVKAEDGAIYKVVTTVNTRLMKGQGAPAKVSDLKAGDGVMAMGNMDAPNKTLHAAMMFATDAEQVKKLKDNLGKTYIAGKITAIDADNLKMTVQRSDGVSQVIGLDDSTSFKRGGRGMRGGATSMIMMGGTVQAPAAGNGTPAGGAGMAAAGGESITLADIKVGDSIAGQGSLKAGVFVPTQVMVMAPRPPRREGGGAPPDAAAPKP